MKYTYDEDTRTMRFDKVDTVHQFEQMMSNLVAEAKEKPPGKYMWIMVGPGKRKEFIEAVRGYIRYHKVPKHIENTLKVVQEES